jgi:hypothetical protein
MAQPIMATAAHQMFLQSGNITEVRDMLRDQFDAMFGYYEYLYESRGVQNVDGVTGATLITIVHPWEGLDPTATTYRSLLQDIALTDEYTTWRVTAGFVEDTAEYPCSAWVNAFPRPDNAAGSDAALLCGEEYFVSLFLADCIVEAAYDADAIRETCPFQVRCVVL